LRQKTSAGACSSGIGLFGSLSLDGEVASRIGLFDIVVREDDEIEDCTFAPLLWVSIASFHRRLRTYILFYKKSRILVEKMQLFSKVPQISHHRDG